MFFIADRRRLFPSEDLVSPVDDLAFGIYQDPQLTSVLRELQAQKRE